MNDAFFHYFQHAYTTSKFAESYPPLWNEREMIFCKMFLVAFLHTQRKKCKDLKNEFKMRQ